MIRSECFSLNVGRNNVKVKARENLFKIWFFTSLSFLWFLQKTRKIMKKHTKSHAVFWVPDPLLKWTWISMKESQVKARLLKIGLTTANHLDSVRERNHSNNFHYTRFNVNIDLLKSDLDQNSNFWEIPNYVNLMRKIPKLIRVWLFSFDSTLFQLLQTQYILSIIAMIKKEAIRIE